MIDYNNLNKTLKEKKINKTKLSEMTGLSTRTIAKIAKGERITNSSLEKIANCLCVKEEDILYRVVSNNKLLQMLKDEKENKISGGIYHELQIIMTYNSNHIEGSRLSEDQTRLIFETNTIDSGDGILIDDILETIHHFRAIDYCIDHAEEKLSEDFIKELHYILKHDTKDSLLDWFSVGDYKKRANVVGGRQTAKPNEVKKLMLDLLSDYSKIENKTFTDIVDFHANFECIHPFQDGNGRVGRLIAFKECLKENIVPFIIDDSKKLFYYRGLTNYKDEKGWLIDTCLDGQDNVKRLLDMLDIEYD